MMLHALLVLALVLSGTVPQGMMRSPDPEATGFVLCTAHGPQEIQVAAAELFAESFAESPGQTPAGHLPEADHKPAPCLPVTLSFAAVQSWQEALSRPAEFAAFRPEITQPRATPLAPPPAHRPRAPPALA
ncbi:hypothetical protein D3P05_13445 [Paracoccus siganidrum]|uniref:DUF2946 domain-containing protein n=2 Tax=Paracoccus siganidrum TaxID=1276757 RepID=A0A419A5L6_9RHOB|nr:hypothetical protein D3P05_13445 [Paracoccus siganidrum]